MVTTPQVVRVPVLSDNYVWLIDTGDGTCAAVDPGVAAPVLAAAAALVWRITQVLNTHWHPDHTGGNLEIKAATGAAVTGPRAEAARITGLDVLVADGDRVTVGPWTAEVMFVGAHTAGHIAYHFADAAMVFPGDTIFAMGCGRLFEGTPADMHAALSRLAALPPETVVYCAHEYTLSNARWAVTVEPDNPELTARMTKVERLRAAGEATVPTTIAAELATNPFVRAGSVDALAALRADKDAFRG